MSKKPVLEPSSSMPLPVLIKATIDASQRDLAEITQIATLGISGAPPAGEDPPLNEWRHFRLEPDDRGPMEFIGKLVAQAAVERHRGRTRTWIGLHETRAQKGILQMVKHDGSSRGSRWEEGDVSETARVFDSVNAALATVKSATLRQQLLADLGRETVEFID